MSRQRHIHDLEQASAAVRASAVSVQMSHDDAAVMLTSARQALDQARDGLSAPIAVQDIVALDHKLGRFVPPPASQLPRARRPIAQWAAIAAAFSGFVLFVGVSVWPARDSSAAIPQQTAVASGVAEAAAAPLFQDKAVLPQAAAEDPSPVDVGTAMYSSAFAGTDGANLQCLAEAIYYEARGEAVIGQMAVAQVVLNRARSGRWPKAICAVVRQGIARGEKCQFSYACRTWRAKPAGELWMQARTIAHDAVNGRAWLRELVDATHYHTTAVSPIWRLDLDPIGTYGNHIFYRSFNLIGALSLAQAKERGMVQTSAIKALPAPVGVAVAEDAPVVTAKPRPAKVARTAEAPAKSDGGGRIAGHGDWTQDLNQSR